MSPVQFRVIDVETTGIDLEKDRVNVRSARELVDRITDGWELWHIGERKMLGMPGRWQLRRGHRMRPVEWAAIEQLRRSRRLMDWMSLETDPIEVVAGRDGWPMSGDWCYRKRQTSLSMGPGQ